jgi:hypothetical protein
VIAALFVQADGVYANLPGVDAWPVERDATKYTGPWAVVAHPPCARWCMWAGFVESRGGAKRGEDGGLFEFALRTVRAFGGVLEHPAFSTAWARYDLPAPNPGGGWQRGLCGGWVCQVEQGRYGHPARKATWLYAFGVELPSLKWSGPDYAPTRGVQYQSTKQRSITPIPFRDLLIAMARSVKARAA